MDLSSHEEQRALGEALFEALPEDAPGMTLRVVVSRKGGRTQVRHELEAVGRRAVEAPPAVLDRVRRMVASSDARGEGLEAASHALYREDGWRTISSFVYAEVPRVRPRPLREGDRGATSYSGLRAQHVLEGLCKAARLEDVAGAMRYDPFEELLHVEGLREPLHAVPLATTAGGELMWYWAHPGVEDVREQRIAERVRACGRAFAVADLLVPQQLLPPQGAAELAYVAAGLLDADACVDVGEEERALWLLCWSPELRAVPCATSNRLRRSVVALTNADARSAKRAVTWGLIGMELPHRWQGSSVRVRAADGADVDLEFDDLGRLRSLRQAELGAARAAARVPPRRRELRPAPERVSYADDLRRPEPERVYDKAKYHLADPVFQDELPEENAYVLTGLLIGWLVVRGHLAADWREGIERWFPGATADIAAGRSTGPELWEELGGVFHSDMVSDEIRPFVDWLYDRTDHRYYGWVAERFGGDLPTLYHIPDSPDLQRRAITGIDALHREWVALGRSASG